MKPELNVVDLFPNGVADDIAAMLRQAAGNIESETDADNRTVSMVAVQVSETGTVSVYGWGRTDTMHAIGALTAGVATLTNRIVNGDDE